MKRWLALSTAAALMACASSRDVDGGPQGRPAISKEQNGVVGYVVDTAGIAVANATVYLVPAAEVPTSADPMALTTIADERASIVDEPLEDPIALNTTTFTSAVTDASGVYRIADLADGSYFLTVIPAVPAAAGELPAHLPGGDRCRTALAASALRNQQLDVEVSTNPSAAATFVGPSACLGCHQDQQHAMATLHSNGIQPIAAAAPARFPGWWEARAKFEADTYLWYVGTTSPRMVEAATPPAGSNYRARLYKSGADYLVELAQVDPASANTTDELALWPGDDGSNDGVYKVELSYGGGLYKQRFVTNIGGTRFVLPIQFNYQAAAGLAETDQVNGDKARITWSEYNFNEWRDGTTFAPAAQGAYKSFDSMCAGCHFTGYTLDVVANKASAAIDATGYDYDAAQTGKEAINLSCETCHGPGSEHVAAAGKGVAIVTPALLTPEREVTICAQCHTRFVGNGGVRKSDNSLATEAPLGQDGKMPRAGISRAEFLTKHISKLGDGLQTGATGDGLHPRQHHQQASDFLKTGKYRNDSELLTCSACHDLHGASGLEHQLEANVEKAGDAGPGLCLSCHGQTTASLSGAGTIGDRMATHWQNPDADAGTADGIGAGSHGTNITCSACHMPKTAKSGTGTKGKKWGTAQYWMGDISSHLFKVPGVGSVATRTSAMMPVPYVNSCGGCHGTDPTTYVRTP
jgi:hypothetical protein